MHKFAKLFIVFLVTIAALTSSSQAQQLLFTGGDTGWGTIGPQATPPAAFIYSTGVCINPNCDFNSGMGMLNPLTFYPSTHTQTVTVTSGWGSAFSAFASIFAQGGTIRFINMRVLTNDGLVPSNFFQSHADDGGQHQFNPLTATSIEFLIAPFNFQQLSDGTWEAIGSDGNPPQILVRVYGSYQ